MATAVALSLHDFQQGALVTLAFCFLCIVALVRQGLTRAGFSTQAIKKREKYVVSADERLYALSRVSGNLTEWSAPFLAIFWIAQVATQGATLWLGWVYVAARVLYVVLASMGGIQLSGPQPQMNFATLPAYLALLYMLYKAAVAVAF